MFPILVSISLPKLNLKLFAQMKEMKHSKGKLYKNLCVFLI